MGYESKAQAIRRGGKNRRYYPICPAPSAGALQMETGERSDWAGRIGAPWKCGALRP